MTYLWKESLNIDGQQFHQYQQSEKSPLTLSHVSLEINVLALDKHKHVAGLNRFNKMCFFNLKCFEHFAL